MKLYNATFDLGDVKGITQPVIGKDAGDAKDQLEKNIVGTIGQQPTNIEVNAVVFGIDGPGKSLNKVRKLVPPKKKKKKV